MFILDRLWYEGLHPSERTFARTAEYQQAIDNMANLAESLLEDMTARQKELFESFSWAKAEVDNLDQKECFVEAFRLGALFMLDILCGEDKQK